MAPMSTAQWRSQISNLSSHPRLSKRKRDDKDLASLNQSVHALNPKECEINLFAGLPLSKRTATGLEDSHFKSLTDIQKKALPLALQGSDILGAAKTGSGKTLAFLIPVLENLYRRKWTELDGLGALILSPTRELAVQIFEVLRKIGRHHTFSAGLVIGGKSLQEERERLGRMNILVSTPGRMLQHMDQTAMFEINNLQMLVLDEADRIMDMGFQGTVDAIVGHLPKQRQTLLFSATQTRKVSDLARLSLRDPDYVSVHEAASSATPSTLQQHYIVTPLPEKLNTLWSFIKANLKLKILVFLSSGKQVRFVYESFRHLQPGIPLLHLHGRQKQTARLAVTTKFSATKNSCLFATDVVARGLDFPAVDWVIQLDCPEDADTYIHRVGRTARFGRDGRAVLFLEPSEEIGMLKRLEQKRVPIERINVRQKKQQSIQDQLQNMCFKDPELKYLGQKAFVSYVRSIHVQKDKEVFNLDQLPLEEFSASLGLPGAPNIKFFGDDNAKSRKNAPRGAISSTEDEDDENQAGDRHSKVNKPPTKYDRMFERRNQGILTEHYMNLVDNDVNAHPDNPADADEDADFLTIKRRINNEDLCTEGGPEANTRMPHQPNTTKRKLIPGIGKEPVLIDSKRKENLLKSKKKCLKLKEKGTKLVFDKEGNPRPIYELKDESQFKQGGAPNAQKAEFLETEQKRLQAVDVVDKGAAREKKKELKEKKKRKAREAAAAESGEGAQAVLIPYDGEEPHEYDGGGGIRDCSLSLKSNNFPQPVTVATKRPNKWFEDNSSGDEARKSKKRRRPEVAFVAPEILEDLEAIAAGLFS